MHAQGKYPRTRLTEAKRRLSMSHTFYRHLVEKNRAAEEAYREKIARQEEDLAEAIKAEAK